MASRVQADLQPVTRLAPELRGTGRLLNDMLNDASYAVKREALTVARRVAGSDRRLSRFGSRRSRGRVRMNVGYDIAGTTSTVKLRPAALWALTTAGARAHMIGAGRRTRGGRYTRARGQRVVVFPRAAPSSGRSRASRVRTGPVRHPGSAGRGSLRQLYSRVPQLVNDAFSDVLADRLNRGR